MKIAGKKLDVYETALLMWFYGMDGEQVRAEEWTTDQIANAEAYAAAKHVDVIEWETKAYGS